MRRGKVYCMAFLVLMQIILYSFVVDAAGTVDSARSTLHTASQRIDDAATRQIETKDKPLNKNGVSSTAKASGVVVNHADSYQLEYSGIGPDPISTPNAVIDHQVITGAHFNSHFYSESVGISGFVETDIRGNRVIYARDFSSDELNEISDQVQVPKLVIMNSKGEFITDNGNIIPASEVISALGQDKTNALLQVMKEVDKQDDKMTKQFKEDNEGMNPPELQKRISAVRSELAGFTERRLLALLNSHFDNLVGIGFASVPYTLCGDSLFEVDQENTKEAKGILPGFLQPNAAGRPEYRSEMERKLLEDIKTVIIEGERSEITPTLYRYAVTLKLIGDQTEEWDLYLYNSCTKENSFNSGESLGWSDTGRITKSQYFGKHYAGENSGNDNTKDILDCTKEKCRFDQACIRFKQPGEGSLSGEALKRKSVCMTLAHGTGFRTVDSRTGTNRC